MSESYTYRSTMPFDRAPILSGPEVDFPPLDSKTGDLMLKVAMAKKVEAKPERERSGRPNRSSDRTMKFFVAKMVKRYPALLGSLDEPMKKEDVCGADLMVLLLMKTEYQCANPDLLWKSTFRGKVKDPKTLSSRELVGQMTRRLLEDIEAHLELATKTEAAVSPGPKKDPGLAAAQLPKTPEAPREPVREWGSW